VAGWREPYDLPVRRVLLAFEPPDGGVAEQVLQLARLLPEHGWEPTVAGPAEAIVYPALEEAGVPILRLDIDRGLSPARYLKATRALRGLLGDGGFDLLHAHSSKAGGLARVAACRARTPAVYSPHCFAFVGPQSPLRKLPAIAVERALARVTAATICVADDERAVAQEAKIGRPERLRVVHNGAAACRDDLERDPELAELAAGGPLAAVLTALRPQKAVHLFVDAAPAILERVTDARLAVIGDGELRGELERRAAALGLGDRLRFFGFSRPAARQLRELDVFVLPSLWEAFPISILEALACGVPQVATDVGGTREAVADGETGLLCPPGDVGALADRVARLLGDPATRERMAAASRARHGELFTLDRMAAQTAAVYDSVAGVRDAGAIGSGS
jgi:glycosyltransferase involved in cell wall biosynthesis